VDRFISLNRSVRRMELSESLLGIHSSFDGAVVLREFSVTVRTEPVTLFQSEMMGLETPGTGMRR
jgi:hypothetical protein